MGAHSAVSRDQHLRPQGGGEWKTPSLVGLNFEYGSQPKCARKQRDHSEQRKDMDTGCGADPHGAPSPGWMGKQGTRRTRQEPY